ncbi:type II secretion system F family protein [Novispirillum sp. DQ9]|uniref:type II secretion system F family protein n=1 Tax=Novispirillum sp. DQ9 TaxID=3398612 RepID=UPI003C7DE53B
MPQYAYRAINDRGRSVRGKMNAANDNDLFQQLRGIGLELVDSREVSESKLRVAFAARVKVRDQIQLCVHLEQLQKAGVPLIEGLADVRDSTTNARLRDMLAEIYRDVQQGNSLSEAFAKHPRTFGTVFTALLAAGEVSGNLNESFHHLVKHLKWTDGINAKVKKAVRYPLIMLTMMLALFFFMMVLVVPEVVGFLKNMGTELPIVTTSLIATSETVQESWYVILGVPIAAVVLLKALIKASYRVAYGMDYTVLNLPLLGDMVRKIAMSRFAHFFAIMFQSGVPLLQCLDTAKMVAVNRVLSEALDSVKEQVQNGEPLSRALERTGQFPSLVIRMIRIGEDSGNLSGTLENVTEFYDRDVDEAVDGIVAMAEPMLTFVAGGMMVWIIAGVFGPLYDSFGNM